MASDFLYRAPRLVRITLSLLLLGGCTNGLFEGDPDFDLLSTPPETALVPPPPGPVIATPGPVAPIPIQHGPRDVKRVALTFDACSTSRTSRYDERITRMLVEMKVPATIFLGGKWMEEHPDQTRYLASLPQFELANHSYLHPHMTKVKDKRAHDELKRTQDMMHALTGRRATLFRAPYGEVNEHLVRLVAEEGMVTVQFDLASGDADKKASKEKLIEYVGSRTRNGSIVVMHINRRGWHTAEALPEIIERLRSRGFAFVTVSQLLAPPPALGNPDETEAPLHY